MSARQPRFEIVRTDAEQPWHARFRAANGRIVWSTETYTRRRATIAAIKSLPTVYKGETDLIAGGVWFGSNHIEVYEVDERESPR